MGSVSSCWSQIRPDTRHMSQGGFNVVTPVHAVSNCNLERHPKSEPPSGDAPKFRTHRNHVCMLSYVQLFVTPWTTATRLLCPWDSPGKETGVGGHALLWGIFPTQGWNPRLLHWQVGSLPPSYQGSHLSVYDFHLKEPQESPRSGS